jgi:hypothetical protein
MSAPGSKSASVSAPIGSPSADQSTLLAKSRPSAPPQRWMVSGRVGSAVLLPVEVVRR